MRPLAIIHLFPDLLNLYGDGGNVKVLVKRAEWRGVSTSVRKVEHGESVDFSAADLVFLGGGPDREQRLASDQLLRMRDQLAEYVESDGPLLAICGGYQILGRTWLLGDESVEGLGVVGAETRRAPGGSRNRLVGDVALSSPLATRPVIGYENHAGRTFLDAGVEPFGRVIGSAGRGNNDTDKADGVLYRSLVGTYLHGPLLAKNPEVADWLLARALERRAKREGEPVRPLGSLADAQEAAANEFMARRLGVR